MSRITTHVLDTMRGKPAAGIHIRLRKQEGRSWALISSSNTDADGRCSHLADAASPGVYRLTFETGPYLEHLGRKTIYPKITIVFTCTGEPHYHLPLLLSDNSYTTYRGS